MSTSHHRPRLYRYLDSQGNVMRLKPTAITFTEAIYYAVLHRINPLKHYVRRIEVDEAQASTLAFARARLVVDS